MITPIEQRVAEIIKPVYLVGGSVRDMILGREVNDWDFTTPMLPDDIEAAFRATGRKVWISGKKFGTIASKVEVDGKYHKVEVTTFRTEEYEDTRRPVVEFVEHIEEDLARRDFTINAIAKRGHKVIDPFNGMEDIENQIIRAVGNPRQRFKEDPLRLMRAARLASQLGFSIEENTFAKMCERAHSVISISKERICEEMDKILLSKKPSVGLEILMNSGILGFILPELSVQYQFDQRTPYHDFDLWTHTLKTVDAIPRDDLYLRWAGLLHDVAKPFTQKEKPNGNCNYIKHDYLGADMVVKIALHLKWSKEQREFVSEAVRQHITLESPLKGYDSGAQKRRENDN